MSETGAEKRGMTCSKKAHAEIQPEPQQGPKAQAAPDMTMTRIEEAMYLFMNVFNMYTGKEGNFCTLTKKDLVTLLKKEFPEADKDSAEVDSLFHKLDDDGDGFVTFKEFVSIVTDVDLMSKK